MRIRLATAVISLVIVSSAGAAEFYVSPSGAPTGDGGRAQPWDMKTALGHPPAVGPGDTIWLMGGTYSGRFTSTLAGATGKPIVVRQSPGERAVIDGASGGLRDTLSVRSSWTWYWGLEVTNTTPARYVADYMKTYPNCRAAGVVVLGGTDNKFTNMAVHDTGQGFGLWSATQNAELYGCLVYYNGYQSDLRGHGHGVYMQNKEGKKLVEDNVIFQQFHTGIQAYGSSDATLRDMTFVGNVLFHNGLLSRSPNGWGLLVGGTNVAERITIKANCLYNPFTYVRSCNLDPAYRNGTRVLVMEDNYSAGLKALDSAGPIEGLSAKGNEFYGETGKFERGQLGNANVFQPNRPTKNRVFARPNRYEPGRAHVVVYNWEGAARVDVDLTPCGLADGDAFEVRDAQNYFGPAAAAGTFRRAKPTVSLPTDLTAVAPAVDAATLPRQPGHTGPEFNVFVVAKAGALPKPTPTSGPATGPASAPTSKPLVKE